MKTTPADVLTHIAVLLEYPKGDLMSAIARARKSAVAESLEAAAALEPFAGFAQDHSQAELEEAFVQTFDLNPSCALEIGWHLYGEDYKRGAFLVEMRGFMRRLAIAEDSELPDHLRHVLEVLARLEPAAGWQLAQDKVLPALAKMRLASQGAAYDAVLRAVELLIETRFAAAGGAR
ncbi:MAG: nitrate reductase molybdenum cofactor assembly chaperone [Elusimicrobia bacterium]|nr:nitrate reductase molybdenum cofactor assembly chaperone [Elusimicrobiota bacterium]